MRRRSRDGAQRHPGPPYGRQRGSRVSPPLNPSCSFSSGNVLLQRDATQGDRRRRNEPRIVRRVTIDGPAWSASMAGTAKHVTVILRPRRRRERDIDATAQVYYATITGWRNTLRYSAPRANRAAHRHRLAARDPHCVSFPPRPQSLSQSTHTANEDRDRSFSPGAFA